MRKMPLLLILSAVLLPGLAGAQSGIPRRSPDASRSTAAPQSARQGFEIQVTEPKDGAIIMGLSRISAAVKAEDTSRIKEVAFYVDDKMIFMDREAPYQTQYDFGPQPRKVVVKAVATHTAGFTVEHAVVTRELQLSYSVEVRRVVLTVTVTGDNGVPVTGLRLTDFEVKEDGKKQQILEFNVEERPLRLALVLDTSGSMREKLIEVQMAAAGFLDVMLPEDKAMVVDFDDQVMLLQDLTADRESLRDVLMSTYARGGTALYDAVHATLRRLAPERERKAIVLLSDGGDTASVMDKDLAMQATRSNDVLIYAIGISGADHSVLKNLSKEAGGRAFFVDSAKELTETYQQIADELRQQYIITYASTNPQYDGKWRKLDVDYVGKGSYKVRARTGYYAVRGTHRPLEAEPVSLPTAQDPAAVTSQADPAAAAASEDDAAPEGPPGAE